MFTTHVRKLMIVLLASILRRLFRCVSLHMAAGQQLIRHIRMVACTTFVTSPTSRP